MSFSGHVACATAAPQRATVYYNYWASAWIAIMCAAIAFA
jgi:hypothetical protein